MKNNSAVLVTGAAGFIGSYLVDHLLADGHFVVGVDNFFRGTKENLVNAYAHKDFIFVHQDLSSPEALSVLKEAYAKYNVNTVFHLAAINGTEYFYDLSSVVLDVNTMVNRVVAQSIVDSSVKYIIYSSTSEVYGEPYILPTPESHPILLDSESDRDSYASSKALGEFYVRLYSTRANIKYLNLRIFNQYGPRMVSTKYGQVVAEFISKALKADKFTIIGDGSHTRSFCYVEDCASLILKLFKFGATGVVNVGGGEEITILSLAKRINEMIGRRFEPVFTPGRKGDHMRRAPAINRLIEIVGADFEFTTLDVGLKKTISYYKNLVV